MSNGNKRSSDDGSGNDERSSKRQRHDYDSINSEIRILLPSKNVGAIIGKGGENIKRLRKNFQAGISLPDSHGPERLLLIRGQIGQICEIVADVVHLIDKPGDAEEKDDCEVRLLVHQSHAGRIIGKGGTRVKELKEETSTQVRVFTECAPESTERVCQVSGKPEQVAHCVGRILEILDGTPALGVSFPYNPNNFDEGFSQQYGGFVGTRQYRKDKNDRGDWRGDMNRGRDFGPRGDFGRDYGSRGGGFDAMGPGMMHGGYGGGLGGGLMGALAMKNMMVQGAVNKTTTSQVSIPKALAGLIIGKGGLRIRQVQMESGTVIQIDDPSTESEERIITIHGTHDQIEHAQYLLQTAVKQHATM